jgi:hypothetical protein
MFGAFESLHDIRKELRKNWKKGDVTDQYLYDFRRVHGEEIDRLQAEYMNHQHHILASVKYYRLKVLSRQIADLEAKIWQPAGKGTNGEAIVYQGNHRDLGYLLSLARQEMEAVEEAAPRNFFVSQQVKEYYILTNQQISEEEVKQLTPEDWKRLQSGSQGLIESPQNDQDATEGNKKGPIEDTGPEWTEGKEGED